MKETIILILLTLILIMSIIGTALSARSAGITKADYKDRTDYQETSRLTLIICIINTVLSCLAWIVLFCILR